MRQGWFGSKRSPEETKRLVEMVLMVFVTVSLVSLSRLEARLFDISKSLSSNQDFFTSVIYFGLINLNVIFILILGWLIFRNLARLVVERRRGVIGSRLRAKLVISLVIFAVAPTALMFYISSRFVIDSFDNWFSSKVRTVMQETREAGAEVYKQDQRRLESLARIALQKVSVKPTAHQYPGQLSAIDAEKLASFGKDYRVDAVKVFNRMGRQVWPQDAKEVSAEEKRPQQLDIETGEVRIPFVLEAIDRFLTEPGLVSKGTVENDQKRDVVKGVAPIVDPDRGVLLGIVMAEEHFETQLLRSIETILADFASLRPGAQLIRMSYLILLIVMVLIIIFSATWMGFYVARGITVPIQNLAEATREVALGNYRVQLKSVTDDETGQLVKSFNQMTHDLLQHQEMVAESQARLEHSNQQLEERRKYMEFVLRSVNAGVISVDNDGRISTLNRAAERLLNVNSSRVQGRPVAQGLGEELYSQFWLPLTEPLASRSQQSGEVELKQEGGNLSLLADASHIYDIDDKTELGTVIVFDDATEQIKVQRVAAWREVAKRIAHEIKNPITPIQLNAQRLMRRYEKKFDGEDAQVFEDCINSILVQVESLRRMVNEFSKFSNLPAVHTKPGKITSVIEAVIALFQNSYPAIIFHSEKVSGEIPMLEIDEEQLNRAFVNIFTNAIAAVDAAQTENPRINSRVEFQEDLQMVRVTISDNGPGIPDELKDRVIEPYFSTKEEGTGLGLSIVSQIVTDHGGYLRMADAADQGAMVVMEFPVRQDHHKSS